jgi:hypothetical protein
MTVTHSTAVKVAIATTVRTQLNAGSGSSQAIRFRSAGLALLASFALDATPWGAANGSGTITANITAPGTTTVGTSGTVAIAEFVDKDATLCISMTVAVSSGDINFDSIVWSSGTTIALSGVTYTPA